MQTSIAVAVTSHSVAKRCWGKKEGRLSKWNYQSFGLFVLNCSTERSSDPKEADDSCKEKQLLPKIAVFRGFK